MYNPTQRCWLRIINVTSALSRVDSALHREDVTTVVGFLASKRGRSVDEYEISVATTTEQLLSSKHLDYCCCRRNSHADITDQTVTTGRSPLCSTSSMSRCTPFWEPRNAFHWDKTPQPSASGNIILTRTNVFATFIRPSHEKKLCARTDNFTSTD